MADQFDTAVLDVDGTLVDSTYQHVAAWGRAFREVGVQVPAWRIHRAIGMGGDRLVAHVAGAPVEQAHGDHIRDTWEREVDKVLNEMAPLDDASVLLDALRHRGLKVVLATSGKPQHTEHSLDVLEARSRVDHVVTSQDVERAKPAPDLLNAALAAVNGHSALMIGDTVWDAHAAGAAGMTMVGLLTGGFGEEELLHAGADIVFDDIPSLLAHLDPVLAMRGSWAGS
jgi:HAD superfamily hydrolase (TIGR01549 family)